jgi:hypothetical protein
MEDVLRFAQFHLCWVELALSTLFSLKSMFLKHRESCTGAFQFGGFACLLCAHSLCFILKGTLNVTIIHKQSQMHKVFP